MRSFLILLTMVFLSSPNALANSCDCPSKDVLANPKCGPVPAALAEILQKLPTKAPTCTTCNVNNFAAPNALPWTVTKNAPSGDLEKAFPDALSKDRDALNTYFNCEREDSHKQKERFCHFKETLSPLIERASKSANQPCAVQACLFKRESDFSPTARSPVGAHGYIQFMNETVGDLNELLKSSASELKERLDAAETQIAALESSGGSEKTIHLKRAIQIQRYAHYRARLVWDQYWIGTASPPRRLSGSSANCANVAFAAAAMKQTFDLFLMVPVKPGQLENDQLPKIGRMDARESGVFLAGAYNMGRNGFARRCGSAKTLASCINRIQNKETHKHLVGINACSQKDNWKSLDYNKPMKCEDSKCSI